MLTYWLLFILLFGVVVFIHELGHFLIAKASGVYCERFAIGFGPTLLKKKWGETEYAICAFPLGGYVKMRGEDPNDKDSANDPRSFLTAKLSHRIGIASMGPIANLLLPIVVFSIIFLVGFPTITSKIGWVIPGSPAEKSGLRAGDIITKIDGKEVWKWSEVEKTIREQAGKAILLSVHRRGETVDLSVVPDAEMITNMFGEEEEAGKIGISPQSLRPVLGISDTQSAMAQAGFKTGDVVLKINDEPVNYWWEVEEAFRQNTPKLTLQVERYTDVLKDRDSNKHTFSIPTQNKTLEELGATSGELFIRQVQPESVAKEIGLQANDLLFSINDEKLDSWSTFQNRIQNNRGEKIKLGVKRNGKLIHLDFVPEEVESKNMVTKAKETKRQLGVLSTAIPGEVDQKSERYLNPIFALGHGIKMTGEMIGLTVAGLYRLFTGKLSVKRSLGGPISIFYLAGGSYETGGWISFFRMMALLSITLGIINLLPIPVLDGGHIFFFLIEAIKGSPVDMKIREMAQQVGLLIIILLMALTFYVDIERYFFDRIRSLFN